MSRRVVSASRVIHAAPEQIFDILARPSEHPKLDGSGMLVGLRNGPDRLSLGATFQMEMKDGAKYRTTNKVVAFDEGRTIAWCHFAKLVWRYDLEPVDGGTKVTESFDYSKPLGLAIIPLKWPERNRRAMERTLETLASVVEQPR